MVLLLSLLKIGVWATFVSSFCFRRELWGKDLSEKDGTQVLLSYGLAGIVSGDSAVLKIIYDPIIKIRANYSGNYSHIKAFGIEWLKFLNGISENCIISKEVALKIAINSIRNDLLLRINGIRQLREVSRNDYFEMLLWVRRYDRLSEIILKIIYYIPYRVLS